MRCDDGFDIDIALHEAHLTLRDVGFHIADDLDDPGVKTVTLPVRTAHLDANLG
jgi:hypothetical protein